MPDMNDALREAATLIRSRAFDAADDRDGDVLCCWDFEMVAGHERVIGTRRQPEGDVQDIAALTAAPGTAGHIALWDPPTAVRVAALMEACADPTIGVPAAVYEAALEVARILDPERVHEETNL